MAEKNFGQLKRSVGIDTQTGKEIELPAMPGTEFNDVLFVPEKREETTHFNAPTLEIPGAYIANAVLEPDEPEKPLLDISEIEGDETLSNDSATHTNQEPQHSTMLEGKSAEQLLGEIEGDEPSDEEMEYPEPTFLPDTDKHTIVSESASTPQPETAPITTDYNRVTKELEAAGFQHLAQVDQIQVEAAKHSFIHSLSPLTKNRKYEFAEIKRGNDVEIWIRYID